MVFVGFEQRCPFNCFYKTGRWLWLIWVYTPGGVQWVSNSAQLFQTTFLAYLSSSHHSQATSHRMMNECKSTDELLTFPFVLQYWVLALALALALALNWGLELGLELAVARPCTRLALALSVAYRSVHDTHSSTVDGRHIGLAWLVLVGSEESVMWWTSDVCCCSQPIRQWNGQTFACERRRETWWPTRHAVSGVLALSPNPTNLKKKLGYCHWAPGVASKPTGQSKTGRQHDWP